MYEDRWKTERRPSLCTRVSPHIYTSVRKLAKGLGITISEYLRQLIMQDLDSKRLFNDDLRITVDSYDDEDFKPRTRIGRLKIGRIRKDMERLKRQRGSTSQVEEKEN